MRFALYTNVVSAHQLPFAREVVRRLGADAFRYVYTGEADGVRQEVRCDEPWIVRKSGESEVDRWLEDCDLLLVGGIRPIDLMERRLAAGKRTFYMSERWFKPIAIADKIPHLFPIPHSLFPELPGWLRLLHPGYFKMARRFARLFDYDQYRFLPIGPWAEKDVRLLCRLVRPLTPAPSPLAAKIIPWGYFVEPSALPSPPASTSGSARALRVLWVGRMIGWKRVDAIIRAVKALGREKASLDLVGDGETKGALVGLAAAAENVSFADPVPIGQVREIMRRHDVYVLASNAEEGWGAALNEAMEEGMNVLGTYEAGASAAMLPESHLFHAGDWKALAKLLENLPPKADLPAAYTAQGAADRILKEAGWRAEVK